MEKLKTVLSCSHRKKHARDLTQSSDWYSYLLAKSFKRLQVFLGDKGNQTQVIDSMRLSEVVSQLGAITSIYMMGWSTIVLIKFFVKLHYPDLSKTNYFSLTTYLDDHRLTILFSLINILPVFRHSSAMIFNRQEGEYDKHLNYKSRYLLPCCSLLNSEKGMLPG